MRKILYLVACICLTFSLKAQQSSLISNYSYSGIYLNPAFTAIDEYWKITNNYSNKSLGFNEGSRVFFLSMNGPLSQKVSKASFSTNSVVSSTVKQSFNQGIGAYLIYEQFGAVTNFSPTITYSQHIRLSKKVYFGFGLGAGMYSLRYDLTKINLKNNQDQLLYDLSKNGSSCSFLNVNAGLVLYSDRFRIAYSAMNLTKDLVRFEKNELFPAPVRNHTTNLAYKAKINNDFYLKSSIESMFTRGISADYRISVNTLYKNFISAGLSYRPQKSMGIMVEARYSRYCFNYVFDYNTSQLSQFGNTGHQLGIKVFLKNINRMESYGW